MEEVLLFILKFSFVASAVLIVAGLICLGILLGMWCYEQYIWYRSSKMFSERGISKES